MSHPSYTIRPVIQNSLWCLVSLTILPVVFAACGTEEPASYAARVGTYYLTHDELNQRLDGLDRSTDSANARQQVIEQWVARTLLLREAERLNLKELPEVQRRLQRQRRSVLVSAMTDRIHEEMKRPPNEEQVRAYYDQNGDALRLQEPYVRVRYLSTSSLDSAQAVRAQLQQAESSDVDSLWNRLQRRHAADPTRSQSLSRQIVTVSRLVSQVPFSRPAVNALREGELGPVRQAQDHFHVLQVAERLPKGAIPDLKWVREDIQRRLQIQNRKQMYTREVERLRNRARANEELDVPQ